MANLRMKPTDLFGVAVVDEHHSQVVAPDVLRGAFLTELRNGGIECSLDSGDVTLGDKTYKVEVIVATASVNRVFNILHAWIGNT